MGVYIKNMDMPKDCFRCPFHDAYEFHVEEDKCKLFLYCKLTGEESSTLEKNSYLPNCPMTEECAKSLFDD